MKNKKITYAFYYGDDIDTERLRGFRDKIINSTKFPEDIGVSYFYKKFDYVRDVVLKWFDKQNFTKTDILTQYEEEILVFSICSYLNKKHYGQCQT